MRPRPPSQIITYLEISEPPSLHCPNHGLICYIGSYPLSHRTSKALSFHTFSSPCHITLVPSQFPPLSANIQLPYFLSPKSDPPPPRMDFTSTDAKLKYNQSTLSAFGISTPPINQSPPFLIYTDGSCPDQFHISPESIFLDLYGPVGSLPLQVNGSNNTAELQAPLEAIAFMLQHPFLPPHIIFHLDSQYVLDLLLGLSLPSSNLELQFFYWIVITMCPRRLLSNSEKSNLIKAYLSTTEQTSMPIKDSPLTPLPEDLPPFHPLNFLLYLT